MKEEHHAEISELAQREIIYYSHFSLFQTTLLQSPPPPPSSWLAVMSFCGVSPSFCSIWRSLPSHRTDATHFRDKRKKPEDKCRKSYKPRCFGRERSVEEERWQQQRNTAPLMEYSRLWLKTNQSTTNVFLFLFWLLFQQPPGLPHPTA